MDRQSQYRRDNPEKAAAHDAVTAALRRGSLKKPLRCEGCHTQARLTGHHEDYKKLLDVKWLCGWCHYQTHARLRGKPVPKQPLRRFKRIYNPPLPRSKRFRSPSPKTPRSEPQEKRRTRWETPPKPPKELEGVSCSSCFFKATGLREGKPYCWVCLGITLNRCRY